MSEFENSMIHSHIEGDLAVIYAGDYLNKLTGERIERECQRHLDLGCRGLVIDFKDTSLVNSIGVSILLGVIDAAGSVGARLVFSEVNPGTIQLFEMLGLTKHVALAADEAEAVAGFFDVQDAGFAGN